MEELKKQILEALYKSREDVSVQKLAELTGKGSFERDVLFPSVIYGLGKKGLLSYNIYDVLAGKPAIWITEKGTLLIATGKK